jgi:hypothetical protein
VPNFVAKLIAGGLSAAVILVWWPSVFPGDTVASWLARGVAWTLAFELFAHAFAPLERSLWDTAPGRRLRDRAAGQGAGLALGRSATLACSALVVVGFLLAVAPDQPHQRAAGAPQRVTEVQRVVRVVRKPVEVTRVVTAARGPAASAPTGSAPARSRHARVQPAPADHPAPQRTATPRRQNQTTPAPATAAPAQPAPEATGAPMDGGQAGLAVEPRSQAAPRLVTPS